MSVWRYIAVTGNGSRPERRMGEMGGESAAAVRALLRRQGLQILELRAAAAPRPSVRGASASMGWWQAHLRKRRRLKRAEFFDGLATMLDAGVALLESIDTMGRAGAAKKSAGFLTVLLQIRDAVQSGSSLAHAMSNAPAWFDAAEVAMIEAGQHGGNLATVLRMLAERHERSGELSQKLTGALAYPAIVALLGIGVVIFLSTQTLPTLVQVLKDAKVDVPALTTRVMAVGQFLAHSWWLFLGVLLGLAALIISGAGALALRNLATRLGRERPWQFPLPAVARRLAIASIATRSAELLRSGVPLVEALRVLAPTAKHRALRDLLTQVALRVERGEDLSEALGDARWFDAEFRALVSIGQASGELETMLERLGQRYERQGRRLIDRLAALLEPTVILTLATLVGLVVMAAVLPIVRLQEAF